MNKFTSPCKAEKITLEINIKLLYPKGSDIIHSVNSLLLIVLISFISVLKKGLKNVLTKRLDDKTFVI